MADETKDLDFDLDEDLFDFGEASLADVFDGEDDADLDEIFAAFQEARVAELAQPEEEEEPEDEELFPPEPRRAAPVSRAAGTDRIWTPESVLDREPAPRSKRPTREAPPTVVASAGLSRTVVWAIVALTSVNALVAIVTLASMSTMRESMVQVGRDVSATADEIRTGAYEQARVLNELQTPVVPVDAEQHPTFERARAEIAKGHYEDARRRLYALLSIIDRLDPEQRAKVEARSQYLLAEALHLEALHQLEAEQ